MNAARLMQCDVVMKTILLLSLLFLAGCMTSATRATAYCDSMWKDRYASWTECYQMQLPQQNPGAKMIGSTMQGMGNGLTAGSR